MKFTMINNSIRKDESTQYQFVHNDLNFFKKAKLNLDFNLMIKRKLISTKFLKNLHNLDNILNNLLRYSNHQFDIHILCLLHHHSIIFQEDNYYNRTSKL